MTHYKIAFPCPESVELVSQFEQGLITETEMYQAQIALAKRAGFKTEAELTELSGQIFIYGVAAGKFTEDGEDCDYCDDFASLRDALVAWEEYKSAPWCRIEFRLDNFVYALDPYKIRRARKVEDNGVKRTIYDFCHPDGQFRN